MSTMDMADDDILVIGIPYVAYRDMEESFSDSANLGELNREAFERFLLAKELKVGRGLSMQVAATRPLWEIIRKEVEYRWEINGGNGNPYGVEDTQTYAAERRACKVALDRIDAQMAKVAP